MADYPGTVRGGYSTAGASAKPPAGALDSAWAQKLLMSALHCDEGADPYPTFHRLRAAAPILRLPGGVIVLSRYADCEAAFRHRSLGVRPDPVAGFGLGRELSEQTRRELNWVTRTMMLSNPPEHTRLRRLVSSAFTPRHVEQLHTEIVAHVDRALSEIAGQPGADFMSTVALPFPAKVMADLLGIPDADIETCIAPCMALSKPNTSKDVLGEIMDAQAKLRAYFTDLLAAKRRSPGDDLITRLVASSDDDKLDDEEVMGTVVLLFGAGLETTTNLLGNGLVALLRQPAQLELLRERPELGKSAVEEMLRYDAPIHVDWRTALEPATLAGIELPAGQTLMLLLGAANRDPAQFPDPDRFDITRDQGQHMSFITGIHFCLGSHLARLEARVMFGRLVARFRKIEFAGEPEITPDLYRRGVIRLPVTIA